MVGLNWVPLIDWDENIYAIVTRNIVRSGDFFHMTWNGQTFYEKPPLFFWYQWIFFTIFGIHEFSARLTSAFSGLALITILYFAGKKIKNEKLGLLWAAIYFSSFIPLMLARMAIIDHFFNTFITASVILLYFYDRNLHRKKILNDSSAPSCWPPLLGAAVTMGISVLIKGPLGGVIPLFAYASMKLGRVRPLPSLSHFFVLGGLSVAIASSYFAIHILLFGSEYLKSFIEFQQRLLSHPLDSHDGPFYYHVMVGILGFFPWTPLLFLWAGKENRNVLFKEDEFRPLIFLSVGWVLFVLILFGIVRTKLPHYSASMYIPLALLAALPLYQKLESGTRPGLGIRFTTIAFGLFLGGIIGVIPFVMESIRVKAGFVIDEAYHPSIFAFLPGLLLALATVLIVVLFSRNRVLEGVLAGAFTMGVFAIATWAHLLPLNHAYNEAPVKKLMEYAYDRDGRLAMYRYLSFAVLYYGDRPVEVLHNYKFEGDPSVLDHPGDRDLYVITRTGGEKKLRKEHPGLIFVKHLGQHALYKLPADSN